MVQPGRDKKGYFIKGNTFNELVPLEMPEEAVETVFKLCSKGVSEISVAKALGVSYDTYKRWRKKYPELEEARRQGRGIEHDQLFDVLFNKAKAGNVTACIFLLKSRHGYREGEPFETRNQINVVFELPGALTQDRYLEELQIKKALPVKELKKLRRERKLIRG